MPVCEVFCTQEVVGGESHRLTALLLYEGA
jgi:hypothetical protein